MLRFQLFVLVLLSPLAILCAQLTNYKPAVLTLNSGQTIEGQASLESDLILASGVNFYVERNRSYTYYASEDIKSLEFTEQNDIYESVPFRGINVLTGDSIRDTRLSKFLIGNGDVSLYRIVLDEKEFYNSIKGFPDFMFLLRKDGEYIPLSVVVSAVENGNRFVKDTYKGVLRSITRDWPESKSRTEKLPFKTRSMVNFLADYLAYAYPNTVINQPGNDADSKIELLHQIYGAYGGWAGLGDIERDGVYGLGYRFQMSDIGQSNALSLMVGVGIFNYQYTDPPSPTDQNFIESFSGLRITFGGNYKLIKNKTFAPYLHLAFNLNRISTIVQDVTPITRGTNDPETGALIIVLEDCIKRPTNYSFDSVVPVFGVGVKHKRFWLELTYDNFVLPRIDEVIENASQKQPMLNLAAGYNVFQ